MRSAFNFDDLSVADSYDAMVTKRAYLNLMKLKDVYQEFINNKGTLILSDRRECTLFFTLIVKYYCNFNDKGSCMPAAFIFLIRLLIFVRAQ